MSVHAIRQTALLKTTEWLCSRPKCQVLERKGTPCLASSLLLHVNAGAPQLHCQDFVASAHCQDFVASAQLQWPCICKHAIQVTNHTQCCQEQDAYAVPEKTTAGRWMWESNDGLVMVIRGQLLPARLRHNSLRCMQRCRDGVASNRSKSLHSQTLHTLDLLNSAM